jgi:hypothetical protein
VIGAATAIGAATGTGAVAADAIGGDERRLSNFITVMFLFL